MFFLTFIGSFLLISLLNFVNYLAFVDLFNNFAERKRIFITLSQKRSEKP